MIFSIPDNPCLYLRENTSESDLTMLDVARVILVILDIYLVFVLELLLKKSRSHYLVDVIDTSKYNGRFEFLWTAETHHRRVKHKSCLCWLQTTWTRIARACARIVGQTPSKGLIIVSCFFCFFWLWFWFLKVAARLVFRVFYYYIPRHARRG